MFHNKLFLIAIVIVLFFGSLNATQAQGVLAGDAHSHVYVVKAKLTAYCTCKICCQKFSAGKRTALGTDARKPNGVAAAPQLIPLGSRVYISGLRVNPMRLVDDTGGGMRRQARKGIVQLDVRFTSHEAAVRFGKKWSDVFVLLDDPSTDQESFFRENAVFSWKSPIFDPFNAFLDAEEQFNQIASNDSASDIF